MNYKPWFCLLLLWSIGIDSNAQQLSKQEVEGILKKIPVLISENYVLKDKRAEIIHAFNNKVKSKRYASIQSPDTLAKRLTSDLREISNDKHLYVKYYKSTKKEASFDWEAWEKEERVLERTQNFGFTEVKILPEAIGYLRIVEFMHPKRGMSTAVAAMKFVEHTDGLIIDLRGNGGGYGGLMNYILNHYFDGGPTHISTTLYSDEQEPPNKEYTSDLVYGKLRVDTPLYIITNKKTGSAAEFFCYTLQSFGKAKVIGQATAGAAHLNTFYELNNNFRISISTAAPINPKTKGNWENKGVIPDVVVHKNVIEKTHELMLKEIKNQTETN